MTVIILLSCSKQPEFKFRSEDWLSRFRIVVRSALFWDITQRRVVILYRRFGTTFRSHLQGWRSPIRVGSRLNRVFFLQAFYSSWTSWPLKMGPISCPETSVNEYHSTLRYTPEERRSHQHRGGSLKLRIIGFSSSVPPGKCRYIASCKSEPPPFAIFQYQYF
jgi:hypothetical protein